MKNTKVLLVYTILLTLCCSRLIFCMAKKYPLEQSSETILPSSLSTSKNIDKQTNIKKFTPDNIVQMGMVKHGINLTTLPVKNEYKIGLINMKDGLIVPVKRYVPAAEQLPQDATARVVYAITELLKGPSKEEESKDYISLFPEGTKLENCELIVDNFGVRVKLEFSEEILKDIDEVKNVLIQDQIMYTLISLDIPKIYGADVFVKGKPLGYYASVAK